MANLRISVANIGYFPGFWPVTLADKEECSKLRAEWKVFLRDAGGCE
jgi:hypothetical protein